MDELKEIVTCALDQRGVLSRLKAELRANVFLAVDEQDKRQCRGGIAARGDTSSRDALFATREGSMALDLVHDFLAVADLRFTANVFQAEASCEGMQVQRRRLAAELGVAGAEDAEQPLLMLLIQAAACAGTAAGTVVRPGAPHPGPSRQAEQQRPAKPGGATSSHQLGRDQADDEMIRAGRGFGSVGSGSNGSDEDSEVEEGWQAEAKHVPRQQEALEARQSHEQLMGNSAGSHLLHQDFVTERQRADHWQRDSPGGISCDALLPTQQQQQFARAHSQSPGRSFGMASTDTLNDKEHSTGSPGSEADYSAQFSDLQHDLPGVGSAVPPAALDSSGDEEEGAERRAARSGGGPGTVWHGGSDPLLGLQSVGELEAGVASPSSTADAISSPEEQRQQHSPPSLLAPLHAPQKLEPLPKLKPLPIGQAQAAAKLASAAGFPAAAGNGSEGEDSPPLLRRPVDADDIRLRGGAQNKQQQQRQPQSLRRTLSPHSSDKDDNQEASRGRPHPAAAAAWGPSSTAAARGFSQVPASQEQQGWGSGAPGGYTPEHVILGPGSSDGEEEELPEELPSYVQGEESSQLFTVPRSGGSGPSGASGAPGARAGGGLGQGRAAMGSAGLTEEEDEEEEELGEASRELFGAGTAARRGGGCGGSHGVFGDDDDEDDEF